MIIMALAALAAVVLMTLAWEVVRRTGSGGWTDVVWTFAVGLVGAGTRFRCRIHGSFERPQP